MNATVEEHPMTHLRRIARLAAPLLLMISLLAGCARMSPMEPSLDSAPKSAPVVAADPVPPPPSRLYAPAPGSTESPALLGDILNLAWHIIGVKDVRVGRLEFVQANRYELTFAKGSLSEDITCTVKEYDPDILDIELGPHGTKFLEPVTLSIDFSKTAADPGSAIANGCEPVVWWWNDELRRWEEVPGTTDWDARRHVVRLAHFSRYVVGGKAGWKHDPFTETE
jgi:hypothetical protein